MAQQKHNYNAFKEYNCPLLAESGRWLSKFDETDILKINSRELIFKPRDIKSVRRNEEKAACKGSLQLFLFVVKCGV